MDATGGVLPPPPPVLGGAEELVAAGIRQESSLCTIVAKSGGVWFFSALVKVVAVKPFLLKQSACATPSALKKFWMHVWPATSELGPPAGLIAERHVVRVVNPPCTSGALLGLAPPELSPFCS